MLTELLDIKDINDAGEYAIKMSTAKNRTALQKDIITADYTLHTDDMLTQEELNKITSSSKATSEALETIRSTCKENIRILRLLQILSHLNPGLSKFIDKLFERICV